MGLYQLAGSVAFGHDRGNEVEQLKPHAEKTIMRIMGMLTGLVFVGLVGTSMLLSGVAPEVNTTTTTTKTSPQTVRDFGAIGDGRADDTAAIQNAVDSGMGSIRFPKGVYRISEPIVVNLEHTGYTSISGDGTATILMTGPGPAFRFQGTHQGTASPKTVKENVWQKQRTPMVDGIEIVGKHPEAEGIEAKGTMQLTLTRVVIREALHGVHLVNRNRNVILSECHIYNNNGIGVFLDRLNLHQINIANCHISYNKAGGVVAQKSEIRNLQIGTCDIEGNMGGPNSPATANVLLDASESSLGEVAIVGCTIQHSSDAPDSANIRIDCGSTKRDFTEELRHGNITIADNVLSDVRVNIELKNSRATTITGNTLWKGYDQNLRIKNCSNIVIANNICDRNPRYHYGTGPDATLGWEMTDCTNCTISGNHLQGVGEIPALLVLKRCQRMNLIGNSILNFGECGLLMEDVQHSRVSDCLIQNAQAKGKGLSVKLTKGQGNMIVNNLFGEKTEIEQSTGIVRGNYQPDAPTN